MTLTLVLVAVGLALAVPSVVIVGSWRRAAGIAFAALCGLAACVAIAVTIAPWQRHQREPEPEPQVPTVVISAEGIGPA